MKNKKIIVLSSLLLIINICAMEQVEQLAPANANSALYPLPIEDLEKIKHIYDIHSLLKNVDNINFVVSHEPEMLDGSLIAGNALTLNENYGSFISHAIDIDDKAYVILSPCLKKLIENIEVSLISGISAVKTDNFVTFNLLTVLPQIGHSGSFIHGDQKKEFYKNASTFALRHMSIVELLRFETDLKISYFKGTIDSTDLLELVREEIKKKNSTKKS